MDGKPKETFSNSVALRDAGADLQEDDFPPLLAVQHGGLTNEALRELRREREEGESQEEEGLKDRRVSLQETAEGALCCRSRCSRL